MASSGGMKQFAGEMGQATLDIAKDVKDSVGKMVEQGVGSVVGRQLTPQQVQQKQLQDQKDLAEARRKIAWFKNLAASQKADREQVKQKQINTQQLEQQKEQNKKMQDAQKKQVVMIPPGKRQAGLPLREEIARTRQEIGKGHGVGG